MGSKSFETISQLSNLTSKAKQWSQEGKYGHGAQNDSLLGMAASLFDVESFARSMLPESSAGLVPQRFNQQPGGTGTPVRPEEITSQVLAELAGDLFGDDDLFDSSEFEPLPLRQGNAANCHHYNEQSVQSRFSLLESTLNQILTHESGTASAAVAVVTPPAHHLVMSQPAIKLKRELEPTVVSNVSNVSSNKKQRTETNEEAARRFRPYQAEQWSEKFQELCDFKKNKGHCCVPHTFTENPALARWVKRQRYQYKLKNEGKQSTMTDQRVIALEEHSFIWDSHGAAWQERWDELCDYKKESHHCNVPSNFPSNPQLATWVKCQRRQYKLYWDGKTSNMTLGRIAELEKLGFEWELRGSKNAVGGSW